MQGDSLLFLFDMELSIFVDESGDFDINSRHLPYYIFTLVFHNQDENIVNEIDFLNKKVVELGFKEHAIHSEPLIRKERPYENEQLTIRRKMFALMFNFARKVPITYHSFVYLKKNYENKNALIAMMAKDLSAFVRENLEIFAKYEKVKVYYDNGQHEISTILNVSLNSFLVNVDFIKVLPVNYKLFQVADLICTIELLNEKMKAKRLSKSEINFFTTEEMKTYIRRIKTKRI